MDPALNPYAPGSGLKPPALVGRDSEIYAFNIVIRRTANGTTSRGMVLTGLRGVGKTVLLNEMQDMATKAGWFTVGIEGRIDAAGASAIRSTLARNIAVQGRKLAGPGVSDHIKRALQSITSFNLKFGTGGIDFGLEISPGRADSGDLEIDLSELVEDVAGALSEKQSAFGLFIDEMQDVDDALLTALLATQHAAGQAGLPFYIIGAGLPNLPSALADRRSYAERMFDYRTIARLADNDAAKALTEPAASRDVEYTADALGAVLQAAGGYPYFLQEYGKAIWDAGITTPLTAEDATVGIDTGRLHLDDGFFKSRWDRATPSERRLLVAMAQDNDGWSTTSDVADRLNMQTTSLSPYRAKLIAKGLIYSPEHGQLAYTVPGMAQFVLRHREDA